MNVQHLYSYEFYIAMMSISCAGPVFTFLLKGSGVGVLAMAVSTATAFFLFLAYSQSYKRLSADNINVAPVAPATAAGLVGVCGAPRSANAAVIMANIGLVLCVGAALPVFFFCANAVIRRSVPVVAHDTELVKVDTALLGLKECRHTLAEMGIDLDRRVDSLKDEYNRNAQPLQNRRR